MAFNFYMPDIGEGVVEGEIVSWKVKEGDRVKLDQPLVEVMTDKATVELPSPLPGTVVKIHYKDGQICPVGQILVTIEEEAGTTAGAASTSAAGNGQVGSSHAATPAAKPPSAPAQVAPATHPPRPRSPTATASPPPFPSGPSATTPPPFAPVSAGAQPALQTGSSATVTAPYPAVTAGTIQVVDATVARARVLATPATRRLARQLGVEIGRVPPTGPHGRVTTADVQSYQSNGGAHAEAAPSPQHAPAPVAIPHGGDEERIPLRGIRRRIAESMARSKRTAAHFTYVEEVDMTELVAVRDRARARAAERGVKLNYLPFIVKACVSGLKKWPQLNASLDETTQEIVRKKYYHIGIAAQGPQGLAVSVVRDADRRSIFDLSREIDRLGEAVRSNTATRDELTGSTFTVSSLGKLGGVLATPIINFPEVAILGVHKIEERPAVRHGQIVIRHLMNLSISVDHRIADGWDGAMFVQEVKSLLEDPTTMFMEMV
ncbi:MAG TPA: dihydrolipoamide acetyltransferase family protein [Kofleriaceae bacterium]|jgi:pyruvate dehydrogenase E2 component (dihydrolipoamide acetyltransferase)|nr:dihydrolipoamide acetyltransferase family protein [Kofleriaceae bacterium]